MNVRSGHAVHVLLVEDNPVDVEAIERAFHRRGMKNPTHVASDGQSALERLRTLKRLPRQVVVLLDLKMPGMGGLEFLRALRGDDELRGTVVFVFASSDEDVAVARCYEHQVAGYIVKRNDGGGVGELVELLENYCRVVTLPKGA